MSKKSNDSRIIDWMGYYESRGFMPDFSNIIIPKYDDKLWRPVLMPAHQELPLNATLAMAQQNYKVTTYILNDDLDHHVPWNDRSNIEGSYVVLVRRGFEPDYVCYDTLPNIADPHKGRINLRERMILGDKVYTETGKHLDVKERTCCTGSRTNIGCVPVVSWSGDEVRVGWGRYDGSGEWGGFREVVS